MPPRTTPRNPYLGPREGGHRSRRGAASSFTVWSVLLAPYVVFVTVLLAAIVSRNLGWFDVRATVIEVGGALAAGTLMALLLWPAAYLLEHVLRRLRSSDGFRYLALWILAVAIYINCSVTVLAALGAFSREHAVVVAVRGVSSALVFAVVPLFLVWVALLLFQRRR